MIQCNQKVVVVSGGDATRAIKVQTGSGADDLSRFPLIYTDGVRGRDQEVQLVTVGDTTRIPKVTLDIDAYIRSLAPAAWFLKGQGQTVTGSGVSQWDDLSGNGRHLLQGTDAARPIYLPFSGTRYLYLPGVAGNYASTPDSAANSITGDIEIIVYCTRTVGGVNQRVVSKSNVTNAYALVFSSGDAPLFVANGVSVAGDVNSVQAGTFWIKCSRVASTGVVAFSKSTDGVSWSSIGGGTGATGNLSDGADALCIGVGADGSTQPFTGRIYRAIIKNGIDGTTVVDFNPADADGDGDTSFASSTTGETWTINSTGSLPAQIVGRASALFNGTSHYLKTNAFTLDQPTWVIWVGKQVSWTDVDFLLDGNAVNSGRITQRSVSPRLSLFAGTAEVGAASANAALTVGNLGVVSGIFNGASSSLQINKATAVTGNAGASNMGGLTLGTRGDAASGFSNISTSELIVFPFAPTAEQQSRIIAGLMARHGVA